MMRCILIQLVVDRGPRLLRCETLMHNLKLIGCRGNDPDAPRLLRAEGWLYGFRSDATAYHRPYFIDINWRDYVWSDHLAVIRAWRPVMAIVADYEKPAQRLAMLTQVRDIRALGVQPLVCPKFPGATLDIPADCVIAVSVPTGYAGFLPAPQELRGRDLHFLGGHPDQHVILMGRYKTSRLLSIDCSTIFQKAQFGAFWSARHNTWRYVKHQFSTHTLTRMSARTIRRYLTQPPLFFTKDRRRLTAVGFALRPFLFEID